MNSEIVEMITWLLLEARQTRGMLSAEGIYTLIEIRKKWNIEKADKVFAAFCRGE